MRRTSMAELERRVDLSAPAEIAGLEPWKASHVRDLAERLDALAPRLDGVRVVLAVLEVHDLVRDALARVLPTAGAEVILLGANAPIDGIMRAAIEEDADAIVLGVYNGNALALGQRLAVGARDDGWSGTIYMGGILNQDTGHGLPIDARPALAEPSACTASTSVDSSSLLLAPRLTHAARFATFLIRATRSNAPHRRHRQRRRRSSKTWRNRSKDAGFDAVLTNDHVAGGHPDRQRPGEKVHTYDVPCHEPLVFLSFLGAVTTRLELATSIVISTQRQTVLLAKQAAELDLLTGGRLRLGVGIGRNWMEYEVLEQDFTNRGRRIEEQVDVLRLLWTQELVTFEGSWHHLDRIGINPLAGAAPDPHLDGLVRRQHRREGPRAHGSPRRRLDAAVPAWRSTRRTRSNDSAATPPRPAAIRTRSASSAACGSASRRRSANVGRHRGRLQALGATHLRVSTAGGGYATPAEHLAASIRWHDAVSPVARS